MERLLERLIGSPDSGKPTGTSDSRTPDIETTDIVAPDTGNA